MHKLVGYGDIVDEYIILFFQDSFDTSRGSSDHNTTTRDNLSNAGQFCKVKVPEYYERVTHKINVQI